MVCIGHHIGAPVRFCKLVYIKEFFHYAHFLISHCYDYQIRNTAEYFWLETKPLLM